MEVLPAAGMGIVEQAYCGAHSLCLLLYVWDGTTYRLFEFSSSSMGVMVYQDGTVIAGDRDSYTDPLSNDIASVYRWDGSNYVPKTVIFEGPRYEGASGTVLAYYNAINVCWYRDISHPAYAYLSQRFQAIHPYPDFAHSFVHAVHMAVEGLTLVEESAENAVVIVIITATNRADSTEQYTYYKITWDLVKEDDNWKLDQARCALNETERDSRFNPKSS